MSLEFTVPGKAVPLARPRFTKAGYTYLPKKSRDYRTFIQQCAKSQLGPNFKPFTEPLSIVITEIRKMPQKPKAHKPITRPDLDNVIKAVLDALNKLVWLDDAQVTDIKATKSYGTPERLHVKITEENA